MHLDQVLELGRRVVLLHGHLLDRRVGLRNEVVLPLLLDLEVVDLVRERGHLFLELHLELRDLVFEEVVLCADLLILLLVLGDL